MRIAKDRVGQVVAPDLDENLGSPGLVPLLNYEVNVTRSGNREVSVGVGRKTTHLYSCVGCQWLGLR